MDANFDNLSLTPAPFPSSQASSLLYGAGDSGTLYTMTIGGAVTSIGAIGTTMFDIAMYNGALYGIDGTSSLYSINTTTGHGTLIGSTGQVVNALTFSPTGVLYAAGNDTLYTVNVSNGKLTAIGSGTGAGTYSSSGDLEFLNGVLYLTSSTGGNDQLFSINAANGQGHLIGSLGFPQVYGLVQKNGLLYGFTDTGSGTQNILSINTTTGAGTTIHTYTLTVANVGFYGTTDDPLDSPEPGPLGLVGLGLAVVVAASRWRLRVSCRFHQRRIPFHKQMPVYVSALTSPCENRCGALPSNCQRTGK